MKMILEERAAAAAGLTEGDKKALDFIVANKKSACFLSSYEIAARIGTSPSTVVRLSKKLGYGSFGFAAFRRALQAEVAGAEGPTLAARSAKRLPMNAEGDFAALAIYTENLSETIAAGATPENDRRIVEAAEIVAAARNVYIMGFRACAGFAAAAAVQLSCLRAGVVTPGECRPLVDQLIDLSPEDAMIVISFARYSSDASLAAQMARDAGCPVIAMTDSFAAPSARGAAKVILSRSGGAGYLDSNIGYLANMEKLLLLVARRLEKQTAERRERLEKYLQRTGRF